MISQKTISKCSCIIICVHCVTKSNFDRIYPIIKLSDFSMMSKVHVSYHTDELLINNKSVLDIVRMNHSFCSHYLSMQRHISYMIVYSFVIMFTAHEKYKRGGRTKKKEKEKVNKCACITGVNGSSCIFIPLYEK